MRLLIIGTMEGHITAASKIAIERGAKVSHVEKIETALLNLREGQGADMIMIDVKLDVKSLIESLSAEHFAIPVVACGISPDSKAPVAAIKAGAKEYVPLPPDAEMIAAVLEAVSCENTPMLFRDPSMRNIVNLVDQIAPSDASVLITGESGTGKEVLSRYIHQHSRRKDKPFISVNCAAIPDNLLESELFGHEKGAFTGAIARRIGKFEEANHGTMLLDEISEMQPALQAKLLRAIQEREIDRVGGSKPVPVDIRILATSNRDLIKEVSEGRFREDLYFRLNVISLELPPLRKRPLDIDILATHFCEKYCVANGIPSKTFSASARQKLHQHNWRGNVRELENIIHRAVIISLENLIEAEAITIQSNQWGESSQNVTSTSNVLVGRTVADVEKDLILGTLSSCLGNRTQAANILGISIRTLRNKLKLYTDSDGEAINIKA